MSTRAARCRPPGRGFTLVELVLALLVLGVLVAVALPSMAQFLARKRVDSTANELLASLRYARSLPMQTGKLIYVTFRSDGAFHCYSVHSEPGAATCDCLRYQTQQATCTTAPQPVQPIDYRTVVTAPGSGITFTRNPDVTIYDSHTGLPNSELTVDVSSSLGGTLRVHTNLAGRPEICAVSGHPSYTAC